MSLDNENYIVVQGWDDQTGQWFDIDEATDTMNANRIIRERASDPINDSTTHYSVVTFKRVVCPVADLQTAPASLKA